MKHHLFALLCLSLVLLTTLACNLSTPIGILRTLSRLLPGFQPTATATLSPPNPTATPLPQVYQLNRVEESEDGTYQIEINQPELVNAGEAGADFNAMVEQLLVTQVEYFKANVIIQQDTQTQAGLSTYSIDFNLYRQDSRFVSLLFIEEIYYFGAAHPGRQHYPLNYSLTEARFYELADLFLPGSPYIYTLAETARQELIYSLGADAIFESGLLAVPENYARWNITPNGLLITFGEYQVTAYANGAPQVLIPYSVLEPYIDPDGPLAFYLTDSPSDF
jgi:hypothetical protein